MEWGWEEQRTNSSRSSEGFTASLAVSEGAKLASEQQSLKVKLKI